MTIPLTLTQSGVYTFLVVLVAHRMRLRNTTRPPTEESRSAPTIAPTLPPR